ncbi:MAG: FGGY family carbohydrate kinase [Desulforhabdus sp.]|jgi:xylulokinase|nr:FGGY family carbohydrate kinase [Desulforhabdus sp.]
MGFLVIDNGTSQCRAAVVSATGKLVSASRAPVKIDMRPHAIAEVDTEHVWHQVMEVITAEVQKHPGVLFDAVGVSAMLGYVFLDKHNRPLMPAIIWMDNRATAEAKTIQDRISEEELYRRTRRRLSPELLAPKLLWLSRNRPEVFGRIEKVIGLKDDIARRLTGGVSTDVAHLNYTLLYNIGEGRIDLDLADAFGLPASFFPPARRAADLAGVVSESAARATGLKSGTPVIVGSSDGTTAMYGGGILEDRKAVLVSGTTDVLMIRSPSLLHDPSHTLSVNTGMVPGSFLVGAAMGLSGGTMQQMGALLQTSVKHHEEKIAALNPGSQGLLFFPGLSGERAPYWKDFITGGMIGLTLIHRAEHIFRAVMEGTSFRLLRLLRSLEENDLSPKALNVVGGCAGMEVWNQIRADVLGLEVITLPVSEATVLGTALFCRAALDKSSSLAELAADWLSGGKTYWPNRNVTEQYKRFFELFNRYIQTTEEIYKGLYF